MFAFIDEHFDKLFLFLVFLVVVAIYWFKPDVKGLVETVLGAIIMLLTGRFRQNGGSNNGVSK